MSWSFVSAASLGVNPEVKAGVMAGRFHRAALAPWVSESFGNFCQKGFDEWTALVKLGWEHGPLSVSQICLCGLTIWLSLASGSARA